MTGWMPLSGVSTKPVDGGSALSRRRRGSRRRYSESVSDSLSPRRSGREISAASGVLRHRQVAQYVATLDASITEQHSSTDCVAVHAQRLPQHVALRAALRPSDYVPSSTYAMLAPRRTQQGEPRAERLPPAPMPNSPRTPRPPKAIRAVRRRRRIRRFQRSPPETLLPAGGGGGAAADSSARCAASSVSPMAAKAFIAPGSSPAPSRNRSAARYWPCALSLLCRHAESARDCPSPVQREEQVAQHPRSRLRCSSAARPCRMACSSGIAASPSVCARSARSPQSCPARRRCPARESRLSPYVFRVQRIQIASGMPDRRS